MGDGISVRFSTSKIEALRENESLRAFQSFRLWVSQSYLTAAFVKRVYLPPSRPFGWTGGRSGAHPSCLLRSSCLIVGVPVFHRSLLLWVSQSSFSLWVSRSSLCRLRLWVSRSGRFHRRPQRSVNIASRYPSPRRTPAATPATPTHCRKPASRCSRTNPRNMRPAEYASLCESFYSFLPLSYCFAMWGKRSATPPSRRIRSREHQATSALHGGVRCAHHHPTHRLLLVI